MATLEELLALDQELQAQSPVQAATQSASIDELLSIQSELDQPAFDLETFSPGGEIGGVIQDPPPVEEPGIADQIKAISEVALTMLTGAVPGTAGQLGGTFEQLSKEILSGEFGSAEAAERIAANAQLRAGQGTIAPSSKLGKERLGQLGEVLQPLTAIAPLAAEIGAAARAAQPAVAVSTREAMQALTSKFGKNINLIDQKTGLPTPVLDKALAKRGIDFGSIIDDIDTLPVIQGRKSADQVVDQIVTRKIKSGATDNFLADIRLEQGKIVPDVLGAELQRQGFRKGDVSAAKGANQPTKRDMNQMLKMTRQILADTSKSKEFRPTDIPGDHVLGRFKFIRGKADDLRNDLDKLASKPSRIGTNLLEGPGTVRGLKGLEINTSNIENAVSNNLSKLGIAIPDNVTDVVSALKDKSVFIGSQISKDPTSQKIIRDVVDLLAEPGSDALRAHKIKRQLDRMIDFNKKSATGLTEAGKDFAKSMRQSLNETIRDVSPQYASINDKLSNAIGTMNEFQRVLGGSIDVFKPGASKAIGTDLRGLLSNRKSRVALDNSLDDIDRTARNLGASFDVDARDLTQFANTLDDRFGAVARTSLGGVVESGIKQAARGQSGLVDLAVGAAAKKIEKGLGINDKSALDAMQKLLRRKESR